MNKILVIGAGRSATSLIDFLLKNAKALAWEVTVADMDLKLAEHKIEGSKTAKAVKFDNTDAAARKELVKANDIIISMLPAFMHGDVAKDCVEYGKHMATASYVSEEMKALDAEAKKKGLLLLNECGLDPGIDHASGMKMIDEIHESGGEIISFKSYCGGLVAPQSNDNPWGYKFSWNPRNVVLAGQGTAQYLDHGQTQYIEYGELFKKIENVQVEGLATFDAYANRDSISYIDVYGLKGIRTMLRGTLREKGYCKAWNVFVKLGMTNDKIKIVDTDKYNYTSLLESLLPPASGTLKERLKNFMGADWDEDVECKLDYLELFNAKKIPVKEGTLAYLLQLLLEEKWKLKEGDKDMIVMKHEFEYKLNGSIKKVESSLGVIGKDNEHTAMALTVGLPLAICVKNFLTGKFKLSGVQIPVKKEIYLPLLEELESLGIIFKEKRE
jgi:saccharopine dehydrogenase-like NADP-dependent oxidoreductase